VKFVEFTAADGQVLHGSLYGEDNDDALIVATAMSVPRRYYEGFAQYAASAGFAVLVFDYRGFGKSRSGSLRRSPARMTEWGRLDLPAAIDFMAARNPRSLSLAGQSVAGQVAGLAHNLSRLDRIVFIASQSGYWRYWPGVRKYGLLLLWIVMPLVARLLGFFPARLTGLGSEDLPRNVAIEWARFGRNPHYIWGFPELDMSAGRAYSGPLLAFSFAGDNYAPPDGVEAMLREYPHAKKERRHVEDRRVGHFGFFRRGNEALWQEAVEWLRGANPTSSRA
jgi:predicted alpha/beta hydrolase